MSAEGTDRWLFLHFYGFHPDRLLTFKVVRLRREQKGDWSQEVASTRLWPLTQAELSPAVRAAGFADPTCYGDLQGTPFDPETSPNVVIAARATR